MGLSCFLKSIIFDILKFSTRIGIKDQSETVRSHLYLSPKKLDLLFDVKFDGECDGDGPES